MQLEVFLKSRVYCTAIKYALFFIMSILSEKVLTAAHCCDGSDASSVTVRAGTARHASGGTVYDVAEVKMHPNYDR